MIISIDSENISIKIQHVFFLEKPLLEDSSLNISATFDKLTSNTSNTEDRNTWKYVFCNQEQETK